MGFGVLIPPILPFSIGIAGRPYNSVSTTVLHCDFYCIALLCYLVLWPQSWINCTTTTTALGYISVAESIHASCHCWSATKQKVWKSAFSEGVRQFERQFQVDGDVARNRSMDLWIGEWCSYNFAAGRFHTKKLCSRLFSTEVELYWHKQRYRVFVPPFGDLAVTYTVHLWLLESAWSTIYKC